MEYKGINTILRINEDYFEVEKANKIWKSDPAFKSKIVLQSGREILFSNAKQITQTTYENEVGYYILTQYRDLKGVNFAFDTVVWMEKTSEEICFEWIPVNDNGFDIKEVVWPAPLLEEGGVVYLPYKQGLIKANAESNKTCGHFNSLEGSMDYLAQKDEKKNAYILINETSYDAYYSHLNKIQMHWLPSLGKMQYRRILRYTFLSDVNLKKICTWIRKDLVEKGMDFSLKKKEEEEYVPFEINVKNHKLQHADGSFSKEDSCDATLLPYVKNMDLNTYLDVSDFVGKSLSECIHPHHKMTRKECIEKRSQILQYLKAKQIKLLCKDCVEWTIPYIDVFLNEKDGFYNEIFKINE